MTTLSSPVSTFSTPSISFSSVTSSSNGTKLFACVENTVGYVVYVSTDSGETWANITNSFTTGNLTCIASNSSGNLVYLCWLGGGLYISTDFATTWSFHNFLFDNGTETDSIRELACDSTGNRLIVAMGQSPYIYTTIDAGITWIPTSTDAMGTTFVASSSDGTVHYAVINGNINKSIYQSGINTYGGWNQIDGSFAGTWNSISCSDNGDKLFAVLSASLDFHAVGLYIFTNGSSVPEYIASTNTFNLISSYSNGEGLLSYLSDNHLNTYTVM